MNITIIGCYYYYKSAKSAKPGSLSTPIVYVESHMHALSYPQPLHLVEDRGSAAKHSLGYVSQTAQHGTCKLIKKN